MRSAALYIKWTATRLRLLVFIVVSVLALAMGCTTPPLVRERMVPFLDSPAYPRTQATIMVGSVSTRLEPKTSVGPIVTPEDLKFALSEALKKSDMFSDVGEGSTDYRVTAEILSQQVSPGIEADAVLLVQYVLFDAHSNTAIFQKNLFSQVSRHRGFGDELSLVVEAAVRDSLIQFINAVAATIHRK